MQFEFTTSSHIIFGPESSRQLPQIATNLGRNIFIVTGKSTRRHYSLIDSLHKAGILLTPFVVESEPSIETVSAAIACARSSHCDAVIGIGGGSVIDTAKVVAAMIANDGELLDYLEVIGRGHSLAKPSAPFIALPTTAGTGAEVTRNAVISSPRHKVKVSMRSPNMFPLVAIIDPTLTHSMPPAITASTGFDALTQLIEPFVSNSANPLTDAICREGIKRAARSLERVYCNGNDEQAREDMAIAGLFSGIAQTNAKLGAVHGIAGPIGGMCGAPHGVVCARLLPYVIEVNIIALKERCPKSDKISRYEEIARILTTDSTTEPRHGIEWISQLGFRLKIPPLSVFGVLQTDIPRIAEESMRASSMKGNPITLTSEELTLIIKRAING